jgi:hypothetical protein
MWSFFHKRQGGHVTRFASKVCGLVLVTIGFAATTVKANTITQDKEFANIKQHIMSGRGDIDLFRPQSQACTVTDGNCQSPTELFVQAMDELLFDSKVSRKSAHRQILRRFHLDLSLLEKLQIGTAFQKQILGLRKALRSDLLEQAEAALKAGDMDERTQLFISSNAQELPASWGRVIAAVNIELQGRFGDFQAAATVNRYQMAKDLVQVEPNIADYASGKYVGKPRIYMFCRTNRNYHCLMVMKNKDGQLHKTASGKIWNQPSLGLSRHGKQYYQSNGHTPAGVWRIDGVMPSADDQLIFGKYRRLVLNFVGASTGESYTKKLLPASSHSGNWWMEAVVARNNGRGLFRVHGTGLRSSSFREYYPFVPTSGCVAKRENKYGSVKYIDQRELLDEMMVAQGLTKSSANETKILGLMYVYNLDDKKAKVTLPELQSLGIL